MKLQFTKMHGLGNDFIVLDGTQQKIILSSKQIQRLSDRRRGIGFDQLLLLEVSDDAQFDFRYRIFNADGSEVEQCGNGARCIAKFIYQNKLSDKKKLLLHTLNGAITLLLEDNGLVTVNMGRPIIEPAAIPFEAEKTAASYQLQVGEQLMDVAVVSMGNPHAVLLVDKVMDVAVNVLGAKIEVHPRFPKRVNVGFMQVLSRKQIKLRVFERGTGETEACGSGACAAVVAGQRLGLLDEQVLVSLPGGDLTIKCLGEAEPVWMTGPAESVFQGEIEV
jgi:diaminopimelate epimerase